MISYTVFGSWSLWSLLPDEELWKCSHGVCWDMGKGQWRNSIWYQCLLSGPIVLSSISSLPDTRTEHSSWVNAVAEQEVFRGRYLESTQSDCYSLGLSWKFSAALELTRFPWEKETNTPFTSPTVYNTTGGLQSSGMPYINLNVT